MASAICVEAADEGFGMGRGADAVEVKDIASGDRQIGKGRYILPLKRATGSCVYIGLRNDAPGRGRKRDAVVCRAGGVRQAEGATAIGGDGIRAVGKLKWRHGNPRAYVDVLKTTGNMAAPIRGEAAGSREKAARPRAEFRAAHQKSVLTFQVCVGEISGWRRPAHRSSAAAARGGE